MADGKIDFLCLAVVHEEGCWRRYIRPVSYDVGHRWLVASVVYLNAQDVEVALIGEREADVAVGSSTEGVVTRDDAGTNVVTGNFSHRDTRILIVYLRASNGEGVAYCRACEVGNVSSREDSAVVGQHTT